ncbi:MAG: hypothetical protein M0D53_08860 [Flavobacterium sp. JAD_PAG50586_2]|nr:MAG: hypothetical protein M0D53_08860 [Flavobacterium sp. JAD_PAG50586_2]
MKKTLILIFTFISFAVFSQSRIISNLNTSNGEYQLYISHESFQMLSNGKMKEPERFVINNQNTIHEIIKKWKGKKVNYNLKCDYDYSIFITQNNKIIERIDYNSECNFAHSKSGNFEVKINPFTKLETSNTFEITEIEKMIGNEK